MGEIELKYALSLSSLMYIAFMRVVIKLVGLGFCLGIDVQSFTNLIFSSFNIIDFNAVTAELNDFSNRS